MGGKRQFFLVKCDFDHSLQRFRVFETLKHDMANSAYRVVQYSGLNRLRSGQFLVTSNSADTSDSSSGN